jgi:Ca-activated chloride channel family protein
MVHLWARAARKTARIFPYLILFAIQLPPPSVSGLAQQSQPGEPVAAAGADGVVRLTVTVTDEKGRFVSGLGRQHFAVSEGKTAREIKFFDDADVPMSVGFLIDVSGSMRPQRVATARLVVGRFIQMSHPQSDYFIGEFNTRARALTDWTNDPTQLLEGLRGVASGGAKGNTSLYDACAFALDRLAEGHHPKRVLFIITDGQDNTSRTTFDELRRRVQATDVLIYAVGVVERNEPSSLSVGGQALLDELTATSGGFVFFPESDKEAMGVAERIAVELRHQYVVGFSAGEAGGAGKPKLRKVKIKVTPTSKEIGRVSVRSREGYLFPRPKP